MKGFGLGKGARNRRKVAAEVQRKSSIKDPNSRTIDGPKKKVRFAPQAETRIIVPPSFVITDDVKQELWYSKKELKRNRRDIQQSILAMQTHGGVNLVYQPASASMGVPAQLASQDSWCIRGCERYLNIEVRDMIRGLLVETVLDMQDVCHDKELRQLSESISEAAKELAQWHAKLNALAVHGKQTGGLAKAMTAPFIITEQNNLEHHRRRQTFEMTAAAFERRGSF